MWYLLISIICSVSAGVLFKISHRYHTNNLQIVLFNYFFAVLFCYLIFPPNITTINLSIPFITFTSLGILLPLVFIFLIISINKTGIVKTDAAQRLSLFISLLAAWFIFNEKFTSYKVLGLITGFLALSCILIKSTKAANSSLKYPILVFIGFGIIDILFKRVALYTAIPYTTSLILIFIFAFLVMLAVVIYTLLFLKQTFHYRNVCFGFLVGVFNFGNILFYLKAHHAFVDNPSTVFAGMNMGVILLGSLVGVLAFKERLSRVNYLGLLLAMVSIILIAIA